MAGLPEKLSELAILLFLTLVYVCSRTMEMSAEGVNDHLEVSGFVPCVIEERGRFVDIQAHSVSRAVRKSFGATIFDFCLEALRVENTTNSIVNLLPSHAFLHFAKSRLLCRMHGDVHPA